jgi:hypothetical protein
VIHIIDNVILMGWGYENSETMSSNNQKKLLSSLDNLVDLKSGKLTI